MACGIAPFLMTLSDLEVFRVLQAFSDAISVHLCSSQQDIN